MYHDQRIKISIRYVRRILPGLTYLTLLLALIKMPWAPEVYCENSVGDVLALQVWSLPLSLRAHIPKQKENKHEEWWNTPGNSEQGMWDRVSFGAHCSASLLGELQTNERPHLKTLTTTTWVTPERAEHLCTLEHAHSVHAKCSAVQTIKNDYLLNITEPLHSWMHSSGNCLCKVKPSTFQPMCRREAAWSLHP